jgi:hypothetical protein
MHLIRRTSGAYACGCEPAPRQPRHARRLPPGFHAGGRGPRVLRGHAGCHGGQRGAAVRPRRSGRRHQRPAVGRGRVHADVRGAASVGGCAGRPDRRPTRVRCRGGGIRAGLGGLRPGARPGCAGRRPAGAGCGGRGHDAVVDGPDRTGVPRSGPAGAGGGHVGDGRRGRILGRPGHGRAADPGQLAADLFHQRPGRRGSAGPAGPHLAVAAPPGAVRLGRAGHRRAGDGRADLRRDRSRDGWPGCPRGCWPHSRSRGWVWPCSWPSRLAALIR